MKEQTVIFKKNEKYFSMLVNEQIPFIEKRKKEKNQLWSAFRIRVTNLFSYNVNCQCPILLAKVIFKVISCFRQM